MISWIQNHLIRHGRWIFISLLGVIIIAFVFTIGNTPGLTTDKSNYEERFFYGVDLNNPLRMNQIAGETGLSLLLINGSASDNENQIQNAMGNRIVQKHLIEMIGLPIPTEAQLSGYVEGLRFFQDDAGAFDPAKYRDFLAQLESNPETSVAEFLKVIAEDYQINQLDSALQGPGYHLDVQAKLILDSQNTEYALYNVKFDYESFNPEFNPSEASLKAYYEQQKVSYETEEKVVTSYVLFSKEKEKNPTLSEEAIEAHYQSNKARLNADYMAQNPVEATDENTEADLTFEMVSQIARKDLANSIQEKSSENSANDFVYKLYDQEITIDSQTFNTQKLNYQVEEISLNPYAKSEVSGQALPSDLLNSAFDLNEGRYYSDPFKTELGYAVLFYRGTQASVIPPYEAVAEQVLVDFTQSNKRAAFNQYEQSLKADLEAIVGSSDSGSGSDFKTKAEALGNITVEAYPNFSSENRPTDVSPYEFQAVFRMNAGEVSDPINLGSTSILTYLEAKTVADYQADPNELERYTQFLKEFSMNSGLSGFYQELIAQEMAKGDEEVD
jgi:peptidyl-prolyl cis-trans isomerase D